MCSSTCLDRSSLDSARLGAVQTNATAVTASKSRLSLVIRAWLIVLQEVDGLIVFE